MTTVAYEEAALSFPTLPWYTIDSSGRGDTEGCSLKMEEVPARVCQESACTRQCAGTWSKSARGMYFHVYDKYDEYFCIFLEDPNELAIVDMCRKKNGSAKVKESFHDRLLLNLLFRERF